MKLEIPDKLFLRRDECVFTFETLQEVMQKQSPKLLLAFKGMAVFVFQNDSGSLDMVEMCEKLKDAFNAFFKFTGSNYECTQVAFCLPFGPLIFVKKLPETILENVQF